MANVGCVGLIEIPQQAPPHAAQGQQMAQLLSMGEETDSGVRNERAGREREKRKESKRRDRKREEIKAKRGRG